MKKYSKFYDSYYDFETLEWLEGKGCNENCHFCRTRPPKMPDVDDLLSYNKDDLMICCKAWAEPFCGPGLEGYNNHPENISIANKKVSFYIRDFYPPGNILSLSFDIELLKEGRDKIKKEAENCIKKRKESLYEAKKLIEAIENSEEYKQFYELKLLYNKNYDNKLQDFPDMDILPKKNVCIDF